MGKYTCRAIEEHEYKRIILLLRTGYTYNGVKHRENDQIATALTVQANLGCRIGDIMALTTDSIIKDGGIWRLNITEQKTGKRRYFIVPQALKDFIDDYCRCEGIKEGRLFDISSRAVHKQLRAVTGYLGLENVSSHSFRKRYACELYERTGHDIQTVSQALQHASVTTTSVYIKRSDAQMEKALTDIISIA